ncbi:MAG: NAD(P)H-dependent oxidoreductase subunit E [bacterium]|nr:NAD(P)H-dependent oxidoreductase subunit E [bacterium]
MSEGRFSYALQMKGFAFTPENRAELDRIIAKYPIRRSALIPALQLAQKQAGYLTRDAMQHVAEIFGISPMEVWGVVSFYTMLKTKPIGAFHFQLCSNLPCALLGAAGVLRQLERRLGCKAGETRADGKYSIEKMECLGACGGAPCLQVNEDYFENVTPGMLDGIIGAIEKGEPLRPIGADEAGSPREEQPAAVAADGGEAKSADDSANEGV